MNGVATDVLTVLMADNTFLDVALTAVTATTVRIAAGPVLDAGPDRVTPGQLMMVTKGSQVALVQVTDVDTATRTLTFAAGDSSTSISRTQRTARWKRSTMPPRPRRPPPPSCRGSA